MFSTSFAEEPSRGFSGGLPTTSSNWVANSKRVQAKWVPGRKKIGGEPQQQRDGHGRAPEESGEGSEAVRDLKEYFSSMKQYLVRIG